MGEDDLFPVTLRMALGTLLPELVLVFVVFLVTAQAIRRGFPILKCRLMAGFALGLPGVGVGASERKIGLLMVENRFVDRRDMFGPSLVFRMAVLAFPLLHLSAVKALLALHILADHFVAIQAKTGLRCLVESFMAFCAIVFPFRMALNDLARHQRRLETISPCTPRIPGACEGNPDDDESAEDGNGPGGHLRSEADDQITALPCVVPRRATALPTVSSLKNATRPIAP